jgi:predicted phosphodiesterase
MRRLFLVFISALALASCSTQAQIPAQKAAQTPAPAPGAPQLVSLPNRPNSIKFVAIGDTGTGDRSQYETAETLVKAWKVFPFTFVIMLGDNMYGSERPQDFVKKFELPYKPLLDGKVEFFAALGNHDDQNQRFYKPFNMNGERYFTFKKGSVRFFALDSNYMDPDQVKWLDQQLQASGSDWKIPYFHHPLYSSGMHGSQTELRAIIEPMFVKYGVDVVFAGHEHFYERVKPQKGIWYFTSGGAAKLRSEDINPRSGLTAKGFDSDLSFMLLEIDGNEMYFQTLSRTGQTVDQGTFQRREIAPVQPVITNPPAKAAPAPPTAAPAPPKTTTPAPPKTTPAPPKGRG